MIVHLKECYRCLKSVNRAKKKWVTNSNWMSFEDLVGFMFVKMIASLAHSWSMFPFYTPEKNRKPKVFRGYEMGTLAAGNALRCSLSLWTYGHDYDFAPAYPF